MRRILPLAAVLTASAIVAAQDYKVEVRLVEVEVRVVDRDGAAARGLTRADFALTEDGAKHDIATVQYVPLVEALAATTSDEPGALVEAPAPPSPTWIYVASEIGPADTVRVQEALRTFLLNGLRPGFRVSLAGQPFTANRATLLQILNRLSRRPNGSDGPGLIDLQHSLADDTASERAMSNAFRRQEEGMAPLMGFTGKPERIETTGAFAQPYITEGRVDRQLPVYGDVALNQYFDLVDRMAPLPGKKVIVLLRPGLRLEPDNFGLLHDLASFAVRRRVSFYTVDSRGLEAPPPVNDIVIPFNIDRRRRRAEPDLIGQREMQHLAREGLEGLARETGGKPFVATNRLADAFDQVARDASGYYVLSYYPMDLHAAGRFRQVKITVARPGLKVQQSTRGYYEPRPASLFQGDDRGLALRRAMQDTTPPTALPVAASVGYFGSRDGFPVLVLSAGVPAAELDPGNLKKDARLAATAMVRVADADRSRLPMYFERRLEAPIPDGDWPRVQRDRTAFVSMSDVLGLLPGEYEWRVVFRDDRSGRMGGLDGRLTLADFRATSTASSLLLTRDVTRASGPAPSSAAPAEQPLEAGALRYSPQPSPVFRQGDTVHLLYALYNATPEDFDAAARGMQLALLRNGQAVPKIEASGEPLADRTHRVIQFTGQIKTADLAPGTYTVQALLPNFAERRVPHVEQRFVLLERDPG
jgi:VWFA-related protein